MNCVRWLFSRGLEDRLPFLSGPDTDTDALGDGLSDDDGLDYFDIAHNGARTISIRDSIHTLARPLAEREHQARAERLVATLPSISPYVYDDDHDNEDSDDSVCAICLDTLFVRGRQWDSDHSDDDDDDSDDDDDDDDMLTKCQSHGVHGRYLQQCRHACEKKPLSSMPQTVTKTQCNHLMHRKCLATWLASDPSLSCPVCRVPVKPAKLSSLSPSSSSTLSSYSSKSKRLFDCSAPARRSRRMAMLDDQHKNTHPSSSSSSSTTSGALVRSPTPVPHFYAHHHQYHHHQHGLVAGGSGDGSGVVGVERRRRGI